MAAKKNLLNPLTWNVPIVNRDGTPTDEFQRKWQAQVGINKGIPSTPAELSALLDLLGDDWGDLIFRGETGWTVLLPGTANQVLNSGGPDANPSWGSGGVTSYFGAGDPATLHNEGDLYFNISTTPYTPWVQHTGAWHPEGSSGLPNKGGFFAEGLQLGNEMLGEWSFPNSVVFDQAHPSTFFTGIIAATADTDLPLLSNALGSFANIGHLHMAAGAVVGSVVITANPYVLPARTRLQCRAPVVADVTLSDAYLLLVGS